MIFDQKPPVDFFIEPFLSEDSPYRLFSIDNIVYPLHLQYSFELMFVQSGVIQFQINGESISMSQDDIAIVPPGVIHSYESLGQSTAIILIFLGNEFPDLQSLFAKHRLQKTVIRLPNSGIAQLLVEQSSMKMTTVMKLAVKGFVNTLFYKVLKSATLIPIPHDVGESTIVKALVHIGREYDNDVNLETTAQQIGISTSHLSRTFKKIVGCNFNEYVNRIRVDKSKWLLRDQTMPIYDIAAECGFGSLRSFDRAFKEATNMTPTQYRLLHLQ